MWRICLAIGTIAALLSQCTIQAAAIGASSKATQDGLVQLTALNWTSEISKGAWLIEFYSPYCKHCKKFFPTWVELVSNKENLQTLYPDAPFRFAQVNCASQQDLCVTEGVTFMPRLSIYTDGNQKKGEYTGNREYTSLSSYVEKEAAEYRKKRGVSDAPHPLAEGQITGPAGTKGQISGPLIADSPAPPAKLATNPEEVAPVPEAAPLPLPTPAPEAAPAPASPPPPPPSPAKDTTSSAAPLLPNPHGVVLKFGKDEAVKDVAAFKYFLSKERGSESTFVKFYASWCPHCKAMASAFIQVGQALQGRMNVVELDCETYPGICREYGIQSFPTLRMYNEGEATEYRGGRSFEAMRSWAINAGSSSGVREISSNDLEGVRHSDEVFFLYLHSPNTPQKEIDAVTKASRVLLTTPVHVYRSSDSQLLARYRTRLTKGTTSSDGTGILVFKDHDAEQPTAAFYPSNLASGLSKQSAIADVATWFDRERYPTVAEVTGSTFSDIIHNKQGAPVVLAALSDIHHSGRTQSTGSGSLLRDAELQDLRTLALAWRQRGGGVQGTVEEEKRQRPEKIIFAWIDADRWATAIKRYYNIKADQVPKLVLADGARLEYYSLPSHFIDPFQAKKRPWIDGKEVFEALDLIWQGKGAKPKSSRSYIDMGVRGTTGALEMLGMAVAHHPILAFLVAAGLFFAIFTSLHQRTALRASHRLPLAFDKAD